MATKKYRYTKPKKEENNEIYDVNYDCIYYHKQGQRATCKALTSMMCRNEKCSFYRTYDADPKIPFYIDKMTDTVKRLRAYQENEEIKKLLRK